MFPSMAHNSPLYKLLHSVDPTKVKVPIRERFSKLTLSNKKNLEEPQGDAAAQLAASRRSVSRNIMDSFSNADPNDTHCDVDEDENTSMSVFMEPLQVTLNTQPTQPHDAGPAQTGDGVNNANVAVQLEVLSKRIQSMAVNSSTTSSNVSSQRENAISISSSDDENEVISISNSSGENSDLLVPTSLEMVTSSIPKADCLLADTLSIQKADRLEAFLHDVSQQCREMRLNQQHCYVDCVDMSSKSAKELAVADTESMSTFTDNTPPHYEDEHPRKEEPAKQTQSIDDTTTMSQSHSSIFVDTVQSLRSPISRLSFDADEAKRLAHNDTQLNTQQSFDLNGSYVLKSGGESSTLQSQDLCTFTRDNSVVISETDEEHMVNDSSGNVGELVISEDKPQKSFGEISSSSGEVLIDVARINISAKINIKIQIPQDQMSSEESEEPEHPKQGCERYDNIGDDEEEEILATPPQLLADEASQIKGQFQQSQQPSVPASQDEEIDEEFVSHAESLLDELYGKSWKTSETLEVLQSAKKEKPMKNPPTQSLNNSGHKSKQKKGKKVEDTMLGNFSIFRRNIEKTNLDSTRLITVMDEPQRKPLSVENGNTNFHSCTNEKRLLKMTGDAAKKLQNSPKVTPRIRKPTRSGRLVNKTNYKESDSSDLETENASDDEDADRTDADWKESVRGLKHKTISSGGRGQKGENNPKNLDGLVYLDLSQDEVTIIDDPPSSPPANHDETFSTRLHDILRTCRREEKPKLPPSERKAQSKRKLFTPNFGFETENTPPVSPKTVVADPKDDTVRMAAVEPGDETGVINKVLEIVKKCKPVFDTTPEKDSLMDHVFKTPTSRIRGTNRRDTPKSPKVDICGTPHNKYSFLKSLDASVGIAYCHPDALFYRNNYRIKKDELAKRLYHMYNEKIFGNKLDVPLEWNKKLLNTAGRCLNKKRMGVRSSKIELSEKVLTTADRLRCTLIHEMCHAATWVFNGEGGHGAQWKSWARQANSVFVDLPKIAVCHQYDIDYKYTYKCTLCGAKSHAHSKSKKVENIRCAYCHGAIEIFLNKKDKDGNVLPTPVKEPTGFAKFVKENYKKYKQPDLKHADVMKILSNQFATLKVSSSAK